MSQKESDPGLTAPSIAQTMGYAVALAAGLAALTQPFTAYAAGKRYYGWNVVLAFLLLVGWMAFNPRHEQVLTQFCIVWLFMVAVQMALARWNHAFGVRQLTKFAGLPLITKLLPLPVHFARRVITPLYVFGLGCLIEDNALSALIRLSAVGQATLFAFVASLRAKEDDQLSDGRLMVRSRSQ